MSDLLTGQDFLDGQLHLLPVHGVGDLSDGQDQGRNVPINTDNKINKIKMQQWCFYFCDALIRLLGRQQN